MSSYLLDTDTVSYALRGAGNVTTTLLGLKPSQIAISSLTLGELRFGAEKRKSKKLHNLIDLFSETVEVLAYDAAAATHFGRLCALLQRRGTPIGIVDTMIAAHAQSLGRILVTNNERHFVRVPSLTVENWL
jgi:tRNA(fMet)-specific endonuclease VapC